MIDLSVIIPSYNTKEITGKCIDLLLSALKKEKIRFEIIAVDNGSRDGSTEYLKRKTDIKLISNKSNLGFSKANNQGIKIAQGKYILFLNSDVFIENINFSGLIDYFEKNKEVGVLTVRVDRPDGKMDPACHRGFPTIWRSFCYFSRLEKILGRFPLLNIAFGGYHLRRFDLNRTHEIDSPSGAFYLTKKEILKQVGGFDEDFFMYGEDLDLSYRIKNEGYKIVFYPFKSVLHLKYQSGLNKNNQETQNKTNNYFYQAMKIFYEKHYQNRYPEIINKIVYLLIDTKIK